MIWNIKGCALFWEGIWVKKFEKDGSIASVPVSAFWRSWVVSDSFLHKFGGKTDKIGCVR